MVNPGPLKGYLLEEVLVFQIQIAGYRLLQSSKHDPDYLRDGPHGLLVKGRGSDHQADVLGQFQWAPAFSFPIRLFVEAKWRPTIGIEQVRNAIGVISDVSQYTPDRKDGEYPTLRYNWCYTLFSPGRFTTPAKQLAIAHGISLVELSEDDFAPALDAIRNEADTLSEIISGRGARDQLYYARHYLRKRLGTSLGSISQERTQLDENTRAILDRISAGTRSLANQYVGMTNGGFLLLLKEELGDFKDFAQNFPVHEVRIYRRREEKAAFKYVSPGWKWFIEPVNDNLRESYRLSFKLPEDIMKWLSSRGGKPRKASFEMKETFLSEITVYVSSEESANLFRLRFSTESALASVRK